MSAVAPNQPNQTLYVSNLNGKVRKDELRHALYCLFSQFGAVLDVVAKKAGGMKEQGFVVFRDVTTAATAMRSLQGFKFLGKAIKVTYARGTSDIVARSNGIIPLSIFNPPCAAVMRLTPWACTYIPKDKRKKLEAAASAKRGRDDGEDGAAPSKKHAEDGKPVEEEDADNEGEPNKILFVQNLPEAAPPAAITAALKQLFSRFNGLSDVRLPPGRPGLAFVEYQTEELSAAALSALNGFEFDAGRRLKVSFAAK